MRLEKLFLGLMFAGMFASCSNQDDLITVPEAVEENNSFMAVSIAAPVTTRAFENGSEAESTIGSAIFFFFNADGSSAYPAMKPSLKWSDMADPDGNNVTKMSDALLVFNSTDGKGYTLPSSMIAILNPSTAVSALSTPTIANLKAVVENDYKTGKNFIMSNSVYMANGVEMMATPIKVENIFKSSDAAIAAPVKVYVERLAAKVTATTVGDDIANAGTSAIIDDTELTLKPTLTGWYLAATNPKSKLMKEIDTSWSFTDFTWNEANNFRSYWANSYAPGEGVTYGYSAWSGITLASEGITYCLENTTATPTKFIAAAVLKNTKGETVDFMEYAGRKYSKAKLQLLFSGMSGLYTKTESESVTTLTPIPAGDITFIPGGTQYQVKATLPTDYGKELFDAAGTAVDLETAQAKLQGFGNILYWSDGKTYYFIDIKHTNSASAVIRNHVYRLKVTSVVGLGTPVPDPEVVIIPTLPVSEESYIAAEIDVLSWQVVDQDVALGGTPSVTP